MVQFNYGKGTACQKPFSHDPSTPPEGECIITDHERTESNVNKLAASDENVFNFVSCLNWFWTSSMLLIYLLLLFGIMS
jgi:hypothetical protein